MTIRTATSDDLPAIVSIYNYAVTHTTATADFEPQSLDERAAWMTDRNERGFPILVAEATGGSIIGWASLSPYHARIGYRFTSENSVYVAADHWGEGIGTALMVELIERAKPLNLHAIVAVISGDNEGSVHMHAKLGFEHCGRFPQVMRKFDHWLDVVYMIKLLDSEA